MVVGKIKRIGIALAAFEPNPRYFFEQLESIQKQSFSDWFCVVTCDSPLGEILEKPLINPFTQDERFRFIENPTRLGHKKNFEKALGYLLKQNIDAVAFSDQDDVWYSEKLSVCAAALEEQPSFSLVHSDMDLLSDQKRFNKTAWKLEKRGVHNVATHHLLIRNVVAGCSLLMDVRLAQKYPMIPSEVDYHDHWYALLASVEGKVVPIHKPLYSYRQHESNVVAVSPFRGRFALAPGTTVKAIFEKTAKVFSRTQKLAWCLTREGVDLSFPCKLLYLGSFDFGLGLWAIGFRNFFSDPQLSRACFARAIGKLQSLLS